MPTLPNMTIVTPTLGGDSGTWDDKINAALELIDEHDHTPGKGVAVPVAGLDIDDNLPMGGFGLDDLGKISFATIATPSTGSLNIFVDANDNELYWRSAGGVNVQLTNGASINMTLVGGIVGDYSTVGAEVAYDDSDDRYTFKQQTGKWARIAAGPIRLYEYDTTDSVYLEMAIDGTLAASYTVIWPAAAPASAAQMRINPSGAMEYTLLAGQKKPLTAFSFVQVGTTHTLDGIDSKWTLGNSATDVLHAGLDLDVGDVITSVAFRVNKASDATNTLSVRLTTYTASTGVAAATTLGTLSTNAPGASTITITPNVTIETGKTYGLSIIQSDATPSAPDIFFGAEVTFTAVAA